MVQLKVFGFFFFVLNVSKFIACDNMQQPSLYCSDLNPQNNVDIEQILGMWYGNEIIAHHDSNVRGEVALDTCVTVHLSDITHEIGNNRPRQPDNFQEYHNRQVFYNYDNNQRPYGSQYYHYLRLIWAEQDTNVEYTLRFNTSRRGFWISSAPQKGTMLKLNYGQFTGTVQVMKAVSNHILLTFCESVPGSQLFSIILTRKPNTLSSEDMQSVHSLLSRRGLSPVGIRRVCNGSESMHSISTLSLFITAVIALFLKNQ